MGWDLGEGGLLAWADMLDAQLVNVKHKDFGAVGDGVQDETAAIQAAIDAAAPGSIILFPPGTYKVNTAITLTKPLTLLGYGATLLAGTDNLDAWVTATGQDRLTIRGLAFDDDNRARTIIDLHDCDGATIEDCAFTGYSFAFGHAASDSAVRIRDSLRARVVNCRFTNFGYAGGAVTAQLNRCITVDGTSDHSKITGNHFLMVDQGIVIQAGTHTIDDNHFVDLADNALYILAGCNGITIVGNTFLRCEETIVLSATVGTIDVQNIEIASNTFRDWTNRAIALDGNVRGVTIVGNTFSQSVTAAASHIIFRTSNASVFRDITIVGNTFSGFSGFSCIYLLATIGLVIAGNRFRVQPDANNEFIIRMDTGPHDQVEIVNNLFEALTVTGTRLRFNGTLTLFLLARNTFVNCAAEPWAMTVRDQAWDNALAAWVSPAKKVGYGTAAPTVSTWVVGDTIWNSATAAGGVPGWICTVAGTPGTWKAMAAIAV